MLNDTAIRAMHGKAKKGEKVSQKSDGGGLNFVDGKYWRLSYRFGGKQKTLALGVYPIVFLFWERRGRDYRP